jgi:hypothetical protein
MLAGWTFVSSGDMPEILAVVTLDEICFARIQKFIEAA